MKNAANTMRRISDIGEPRKGSKAGTKKGKGSSSKSNKLTKTSSKKSLDKQAGKSAIQPFSSVSVLARTLAELSALGVPCVLVMPTAPQAAIQIIPLDPIPVPANCCAACDGLTTGFVGIPWRDAAGTWKCLGYDGEANKYVKLNRDGVFASNT